MREGIRRGRKGVKKGGRTCKEKKGKRREKGKENLKKVISPKVRDCK